MRDSTGIYVLMDDERAIPFRKELAKRNITIKQWVEYHIDKDMAAWDTGPTLPEGTK